MKILLLEDEGLSRVSFRALLLNKYCEKEEDITCVNNILDFHDCLFDSSGVASYDKIFMDLRLDMPGDFSSDIYLSLVKECGIKRFASIFDVKDSSDKPEIIGWDYFRDVILTQEITRTILGRIMLRSGYIASVEEQIKKLDASGVTLLPKEDRNYFDILDKFMKK